MGQSDPWSDFAPQKPFIHCIWRCEPALVFEKSISVAVELTMIHAQGKTCQNWEMCKIFF